MAGGAPGGKDSDAIVLLHDCVGNREVRVVLILSVGVG